MKKLTDLAMNSNRLRRIPEFLSSLSGLETLDLGDNAISEVGDGDLAGLGGLFGLKLAGNRIGALTNKTFAHVKNLQLLNLAHNKVGIWAEARGAKEALLLIASFDAPSVQILVFCQASPLGSPRIFVFFREIPVG